ncbi:MAG: hypothetical protein M0C28_03600 [Candidatus Moduliflexus flocculans]|nr:hypothetical protein [Candidatus Moduliflexus flocculans]
MGDAASLPLSGCLDYKKPLARTGGYRFFLTDAYAYAKIDRLHHRARPRGERRADGLRERRLLLCARTRRRGWSRCGRGGAARQGARPDRLRPRLERAHPHDVAPERGVDEGVVGRRERPGAPLLDEDERRGRLRPAPRLVRLRPARGGTLSDLGQGDPRPRPGDR